MSSEVAKHVGLPVNSRVLRWARMHAGVSVADAARRVKVDEDRLAEWESPPPAARPTTRQARMLASLYDRPFLEFFRREPPVLPEPETIPDFRLFPRADDPAETRELKEIQLWAETQRRNALELYSEIGEDPPLIPPEVFATIDGDPEAAAGVAREAIDFPIRMQVGRDANGRREIPADLRRRIEARGVLVFRRTELRKYRVRGFCVAVFPLPIVVFGKEAIAAQSFTLAHEFAHVVIRKSAISGPVTRAGGAVESRRIEKWCDSFAGAFLMPRDVVADQFAPPPQPLAQFADSDLRRLSLFFSVSDHAMLVRLVNLGYVSEEYYWSVKKPQFDRQEAKLNEGGRPSYYGVRYRNKQGELYTSLVIEAWNSGRITNHNAAEYMGIKNISHMIDIKNNYEAG